MPDPSPHPATPPAPDENLSFQRVGPALVDAGVMHQRLEFSARGERVPAIVHLPQRESPTPLPLAVFVCCGEDRALLESRGRWLASKAAALTLFWPLMGTRRSPKLTESLLSAIADNRAESEENPLRAQFDLQARAEFAAGLAVGGQLPGVEANRIAFLGLSFLPDAVADAQTIIRGHSATGEHRGRSLEDCDASKASETLANFLAALLA